MKKKILVLAGTRPEAIKMAPVILELRSSQVLEPIICATGQHKEMLAQAFADFGLVPDTDLEVMTPGQTLTGLTGRLFASLEKAIAQWQPAAILTQGDTNTAFAGAVAAFYSHIPCGHIEAGLRSGDMQAPWPEEFNRRAAALACTWHFAPTKKAQQNLVREGVPAQQIFLTGNTVVDALQFMEKGLDINPPELPAEIEAIIQNGQSYILITGHRRENFGEGMAAICQAIKTLAAENPDHYFIYPVHLNPNVKNIVQEKLNGLNNVVLTQPLGYRAFLRLLSKCHFVLSDSGGVQEEAPSFGKKAIVMRDVTERPEGVEAGFCHLTGACAEKIITAARAVFNDATPPATGNPYGDGQAAQRIVRILENNIQ